MRRHAWALISTLSFAGLGVLACHHGPKVTEKNEPGAGGETDEPVKCGSVMCGVGQICCNPSCGICTAPDVMCTQQFCDTPEKPGKASAPVVTCDSVRCVAGTHCELVQVQCVRAPCNPVAECRPDGGDAGVEDVKK